jgi:hypothetical protein
MVIRLAGRELEGVFRIHPAFDGMYEFPICR